MNSPISQLQFEFPKCQFEAVNHSFQNQWFESGTGFTMANSGPCNLPHVHYCDEDRKDEGDWKCWLSVNLMQLLHLDNVGFQ